MTQEMLDRIVKKQLVYWVMAMVLSTILALFSKLIWTGKFPILVMLPLLIIVFALGSIAAIKKDLRPLIETDSK